MNQLNSKTRSDIILPSIIKKRAVRATQKESVAVPAVCTSNLPLVKHIKVYFSFNCFQRTLTINSNISNARHSNLVFPIHKIQ